VRPEQPRAHPKLGAFGGPLCLLGDWGMGCFCFPKATLDVPPGRLSGPNSDGEFENHELNPGRNRARGQFYCYVCHVNTRRNPWRTSINWPESGARNAMDVGQTQRRRGLSHPAGTPVTRRRGWRRSAFPATLRVNRPERRAPNALCLDRPATTLPRMPPGAPA